MSRIRCACACLSLTLLLASPLLCQESCPALVVPKVIPGNNLFNEQQEMFLGDAEAANIEQSITIVRDRGVDGPSARPSSIVSLRICRQAQLQFRVKLIDVPLPMLSVLLVAAFTSRASLWP